MLGPAGTVVASHHNELDTKTVSLNYTACLQRLFQTCCNALDGSLRGGTVHDDAPAGMMHHPA